jgi:hypothetical protein
MTTLLLLWFLSQAGMTQTVEPFAVRVDYDQEAMRVTFAGDVAEMAIDNETDRMVWIVEYPESGIVLSFDRMFPGHSRTMEVVVYLFRPYEKLPAQLRFRVLAR